MTLVNFLDHIRQVLCSQDSEPGGYLLHHDIFGESLHGPDTASTVHVQVYALVVQIKKKKKNETAVARLQAEPITKSN